MYSSTLSITSMPDGGGWSTPRPGRFTPGKDPVPIVLEAGWAPWPAWTGVENLTSTGFRPPDRPARSESLYRLGYPMKTTLLTYMSATTLIYILYIFSNILFDNIAFNFIYTHPGHHLL